MCRGRGDPDGQCDLVDPGISSPASRSAMGAASCPTAKAPALVGAPMSADCRTRSFYRNGASPGRQGSVVAFDHGFDVPLRMRVVAIERDRRVAWRCLSSGYPDATTILGFRHDGWAPDSRGLATSRGATLAGLERGRRSATA